MDNVVNNQEHFELFSPSDSVTKVPGLLSFDKQLPPSLFKKSKAPVERQKPEIPTDDSIMLAQKDYTIKLLEDKIRDIESKGREANLRLVDENQFKNTLQLLEQKQVSKEKVQEAMHQSDKRLLQSHIDSLEATNEDQSKTIRSLSETINTFEARLSATTQKLEKSTRNNKIIMSKLSEYEEALYATKDEMLNIEREKERIKCWIDLHKRSVEDYEQCLKKLGIFDINASISLGLSSHLQNVLSENKDMKANLQIAEHEMRQVKKETNEIMSKYVQEIAKLRSDLLSAKMDQEHALGRAEKSERERDEAIHLASKTSAECKHLREQITKIEISNEEIMADLAIKSKNQLKSVRDQFEMERDGLRQQIELLHGSKVQLQV